MTLTFGTFGTFSSTWKVWGAENGEAVKINWKGGGCALLFEKWGARARHTARGPRPLLITGSEEGGAPAALEL